MIPRIRVDPDLLEKLADELHQLTGVLNQAGDNLLNEIMRRSGNTEYPDLQSSARGDAFAARDLINGIQRDLSGEADRLRLLSRAFRAIDDEAITFLTCRLGEQWLGQTFGRPQSQPNIKGFEPFYVPQTRMALTDWVYAYAQGPYGLTRMDGYTAGRIVDNIIGSWTDPKTGKKYSIVDQGNGLFIYILVDQLSNLIDLSAIPYRDGSYSNGMVVENSRLQSPWGRNSWPQSWIDNEWWKGGPQQDLLLGKMGLPGGDGNPLAGLLDSAHANLCGELSVIASTGNTDIVGGLSIFANSKEVGNGLAILKEPTMGTTPENLADFYRALGWRADPHQSAVPSADELAAGLAAGKKYIFGARLDTRGTKTNGLLTNSDGYADHWVALTDVFKDDKDRVWVDVYNPYENREEIYLWDYFAKACNTNLHPKTGLSGYSYIEAGK